MPKGLPSRSPIFMPAWDQFQNGERMKMKSNSKGRIGLTYLIFGVVIVISFAGVRATKAAEEPVHLVTDWSHRYVLFSAPHSLMDQIRLSRNPRYLQQIIRRNAELKDQG